MAIKYCKNCKRNVDVKEITAGTIIITIVLMLFFFFPGLIYLVYKLFTADKCPICRGQLFGPER